MIWFLAGIGIPILGFFLVFLVLFFSAKDLF